MTMKLIPTAHFQAQAQVQSAPSHPLKRQKTVCTHLVRNLSILSFLADTIKSRDRHLSSMVCGSGGGVDCGRAVAMYLQGRC
jgi:hypothetical protein